MISLLEKEARDPVEVLRVKLKDVNGSSVLNTQLLQEVKRDYLRRQDSTKGQLDAFVQAHVDEIERASTLLEMEDTVLEIVRNFEIMNQNCRKMNDDVGEKRLSSGISIARRNLKELETQIIFYEELPSKLQELEHTLDEYLGEIVNVYNKWQIYDDWRQKMLQELRMCALDKTDELGNTKAQQRILASMASRLDAVENLHKKILSEVFGCMHHCIQVAQFNKKRLLDAFQVLDLMEKRRRRLIDTKRECLDHTLKPLTDLNTPYSERCKMEMTTYLTKKVEDMFRFAENEATTKNKKVLDTVLDAANQLLIDLEAVQTDVVPCFPSEIDVIQVFTTAYNTMLEKEINKMCSAPEIGIAERLQLVQWIEYYNAEILKYKRARASAVLEQTAQTLMTLYLNQIQGQIHMWVGNVWKREEDPVIGPQGDLQSTRPNDIINILKAQISIGQEWLTGRLVGRVVTQCLEALMVQLKSRYESLAERVGEIDVEVLCLFINDTDILQAKCPELVEEISFAERDPEEKEAYDMFMGDALDTTSTEIVKMAVMACELLVGKIFREIEHDTTRLWLSKKWDEGEAVVETLLATMADYCSDLTRWISGTFFFSKVVRQCLDYCVKEYIKRLLIRTHCFGNAVHTATIVENDMHNLITFFSNYASELRRTGLRSLEDIKKEFTPLQVIVATLRETTSETNGISIENREIVTHIRKLLKSTSHQEAAATSEKASKAAAAAAEKAKAKKLKTLAKEKKTKEKAAQKEKEKERKKDKGATTISTPKENSISSGDQEGGFEVQKLNMADFLGT